MKDDLTHAGQAKCPFYRKVSGQSGLSSINCGDSAETNCGIIMWWKDPVTREEHFMHYCSEDFQLCGTFLSILRDKYPEDYKEMMRNEH